MVLALWWGLNHWPRSPAADLVTGEVNEPPQQRGLALWASLLSALVCLLFLPVPRWGVAHSAGHAGPDHRDLAHRQSSYRT